MIEVVDGRNDTVAVSRIGSDVMRWWTLTTESIEHDRSVMPTYRDWLALCDGEQVGAGMCVEFPDMKESAAAFAGVWVLESARRRGVGSAVLDRASAHARTLGKTELELFTYEDDPDGVRYLERRGFSRVMLVRALRLILAACPPATAEVPDGVTITTLAERRDLARAIWETASEVMPDIPYDGDTPLHPGTFEEFTALSLSGPLHIPEATFIATRGSEVIGYAQLVWNDRARGIATHEMLAVRRAHRGKGIATALKSAQIAWALENGLAELRTANEERNVSARAVNAKYPYESIPNGILFRGPLSAVRHRI